MRTVGGSLPFGHPLICHPELNFCTTYKARRRYGSTESRSTRERLSFYHFGDDLMQWRDRFTDKQIKLTDPALLTPNPRNPRKHPERQRKAVKGSLDTLGWVAPVIVNSQTGLLLDGHERVQQALASGSQVPVIEVDLTPEEELQFLATFDYITYLAEFDKDVLTSLFEDINSDNENMQALIADMAVNNGIVPPFDGVPIDDPLAEWGGMPEFEQPDASIYRTIYVHLECQEDVDAFARLVGQTITDKTKFIYYPEKINEPMQIRRVISDE